MTPAGTVGPVAWPENGDGAGSLVRAVRAHPLLVALVALAAVAAAGLWLVVRSPTYEATAEILVTPAPDDGGADRTLPLLRTSGDRTRIVQTAASLVDSAGAQLLTARRMGAGWTTGRVAGAVNVEPIGQSDVLAVTAQDQDPAVAARLANTFAEASLEARAAVLRPRVAALIAQLEAELRAQPDPSSSVAVDLAERLSELRTMRDGADPTLSLARDAQVPGGSTGPGGGLVLMLALLAGLVAGVGCALLADLIGPARVADAAQASAVSGSPVVARVPLRARGAGRAPPAAVIAAFRTLQLQLEAGDPYRQVVLLANPSSREEAAGCVTDFGIALAEAGCVVLILDLDARRGLLAARLGADAPPAIDATDAEGWHRATAPVPGIAGLKLLSAGHLHAADADAVDVAGVLTAARERFDFVLVNAPPLAQSGEALRVVHAVDAVVLAVRPGRTEMQDFQLALGLLERTRGRPDGLLLLAGRGGRGPSAAVATPASSGAAATSEAFVERGS